MKIFIVNCYDSENGRIIFIHGVFKDELEAKRICYSLNKEPINKRQEIHFDYEEESVL